MSVVRVTNISDALSRNLSAGIGFVVHLSVALLYLTLAIGKIYDGGFYEYWEHFTNWIWTIELIFIWATLPAPFVLNGQIDLDGPVGTFVRVVIVALFFPIYATIWVVIVVVSVLLVTDSPFLTEIMVTVKASLVFLGNDIFHFWPLILWQIGYNYYKKLIYLSHNYAFTATGILMDRTRTVIYVAIQVYLVPAFFLGAYNTIFDAKEVYPTKLYTIDGVVIGVITLTVVGLTIVGNMLGIQRIGNLKRFHRKWLTTNFNDPSCPYINYYDMKN